MDAETRGKIAWERGGMGEGEKVSTYQSYLVTRCADN